MNRMLFLTIVALMLSCGLKKNYKENENKTDNIPKLSIGNGFEIIGADIETYNEFGVFTSLSIVRNEKEIYRLDNLDEFSLDSLKAYLVQSKTNPNQFDLTFEIISWPSKPRNIWLRIIDNIISSKSIIPAFETHAKNLDQDENLEFAGYWSFFELWGDKEIMTSYNPIIFYEIRENGLSLDSALTIEKNLLIYEKFLGFNFSEKEPQPIATIERHSKIVEEITSK